MREVNIRTLRKELSTQLEDLPFSVTKNGRIIAQVCTQEGKSEAIEPKAEKPIICNNRQKTTSSTGSILDEINRSNQYFNPQPKGKP